mgnify:CR=1 FL=1
MDILSLIIEEGYIIVVALWIIGEFIKYTDTIQNKWIPFILLGISVFMTPWSLGGYTAHYVIQSILSAGGAVFSDQLSKQWNMEE